MNTWECIYLCMPPIAATPWTSHAPLHHWHVALPSHRLHEDFPFSPLGLDAVSYPPGFGTSSSAFGGASPRCALSSFLNTDIFASKSRFVVLRSIYICRTFPWLNVLFFFAAVVSAVLLNAGTYGSFISSDCSKMKRDENLFPEFSVWWEEARCFLLTFVFVCLGTVVNYYNCSSYSMSLIRALLNTVDDLQICFTCEQLTENGQFFLKWLVLYSTSHNHCVHFHSYNGGRSSKRTLHSLALAITHTQLDSRNQGQSAASCPRILAGAGIEPPTLSSPWLVSQNPML